MAKKNKQFKPVVPFIVVIVVIFAIGYGFGFVKGQKGVNTELEAKIEKARDFFPASPEDVRWLSGKIIEVKDDAVVFEFSGFSNPLEDYVKVRTAVIGGDTEILKREYKSMEEFDKENQEYQKLMDRAMAQGLAGPERPAPLPYKDVKALLEELDTGMNILVEADENIKNEAKFSASKIVIQ